MTVTAYDTLLRLSARMPEKQRQEYAPLGPGVSIEEQVTIMAMILGAKDPYLAVLYPEYLDAILSNTQPDWMESFTEPPELDDF